MALKTQNKGEWSETYCIVKLLADGHLHLCDDTLAYTGETISILGGHLGSKKEHPQFSITEGAILLHHSIAQKELSSVYVTELKNAILGIIQQDQNNTFAIANADQFLEGFGVTKIKASSHSKSDLLLLLDDASLPDRDYSGFSIKSFVASNPTLVNASSATNFRFGFRAQPSTFDYSGLTSKTLVRKIYEDGNALLFKNVESPIFCSNLMLVDTNMPVILAEALSIYYSSKKKFLHEIADDIAERNPLTLTDTSIYRSKLIDYLFYSSAGIFPNKPWDGLSSLDGGCIIVTRDGSLKSFYTMRKKYLEHYRQFLFRHAYFDTASNTRHKFGSVYFDQGRAFVKLNLQIRLDINPR